MELSRIERKYSNDLLDKSQSDLLALLWKIIEMMQTCRPSTFTYRKISPGFTANEVAMDQSLRPDQKWPKFRIRKIIF